MELVIYFTVFVLVIAYLVSILNYLPEKTGNLLIEGILLSIVVISTGIVLVKAVMAYS